MRIISGVFRSVYETLGYQKYSSLNKYALIPYMVHIPIDEGVLLFNVFTREIIWLSIEEWVQISESKVESPVKKRLVEHWYLIPDDIDHKSLVYAFNRCHAMKFGNKPGKLKLCTIFTTTECNARCSYCYEAGCSKRSMTKETALDVAKFIESHSDPNVHLKWFGGEPLCNPEVIDTISGYLQGKGIAYDASMVSNGYLIDQQDSGKIKNLWRLNRVQITLDGTQDVYNRTKKYIMPGNAFEKVLKNIEYLLSLDIKVNIRLNLSLDNYLDLSALTDALQEQFKVYSRLINVYAHPLFDGETFHPTTSEKKKLYDEYISLQNHINKTDIGCSVGIPRIRHTQCMADDGKSTVILPGGELSLCEHHCDDEFYGTIYSENYDQNMIQSWSEPAEELQECEACFYYPVCIRLKKCPAKATCDSEHRKLIKNKVHAIMLTAYKRRPEK